MQSDFRQSCAEARALITVPAVPIAAIRNGAQRPVHAPSGGRRKWLLAGLLAGVPIVAIAAAAGIWNAAHVSFGSTGELRFTSSDRLTGKWFPTSADLQAAVRQAAFAAELPIGLPAGTRPTQMVFGPSIILISYRLPGKWRGGIRQQTVIVTDPRATSGPPADPRQAYRLSLCCVGAAGRVKWLVGGEIVLLPGTNRMTSAELAHFKAAMVAQASRLGSVPGPR
jgi:hypothetical protein